MAKTRMSARPLPATAVQGSRSGMECLFDTREGARPNRFRDARWETATPTTTAGQVSEHHTPTSPLAPNAQPPTWPLSTDGFGKQVAEVLDRRP